MTTTGQQAGTGAGVVGAAAFIILSSNPVTFPAAVALIASFASIGYAVGGYIDPPEAKLDEVRPDRQGLQRNTAQRNVPVPVVYGTARTPGNVLAIADERTEEIKVGVTVIGSGKSKTKRPQFELQYSAAFAIAASEGPIQDIITAYRDGDSVEDLRDSLWTFQRGLDTEQLPDIYRKGEIAIPVPHGNVAKFIYDGELGRVNRIPDFDFLVRGIDTRYYQAWPYDVDKINRFENHDFAEASTALNVVPRWTVTNDADLSTNYFVTGTHSVKLRTDDWGNRPASISQTVSLRKDRAYRLRFWMITNVNSSGLAIRISQIPEEGGQGRYFWNYVTSLWEPVEEANLANAPFEPISASASEWTTVDRFFAVTEKSGKLLNAPEDEDNQFGGAITVQIEIAQDDDTVASYGDLVHETHVDLFELQEVTEERSQPTRTLQADTRIATEISFPGTGFEQALTGLTWDPPTDRDLIQFDAENYDFIQLRASGFSENSITEIGLYDVTAGDFVYDENGDVVKLRVTTTSVAGPSPLQFQTGNIRRYLKRGRRTYSYRLRNLQSSVLNAIRETSLVAGWNARGVQRKGISIPIQTGIVGSSTVTGEETPGSRWAYIVNDWLPTASWGLTFYFSGSVSAGQTMTVRVYQDQSSPSVIATLTFTSSTTATKSASLTLPSTDQVLWFSVATTGGTKFYGSGWFEMVSTDRPTAFTLYQRLGAGEVAGGFTTTNKTLDYIYRNIANDDIQGVRATRRFSTTQVNVSSPANGVATNLVDENANSLLSGEITNLTTSPFYESKAIENPFPENNEKFDMAVVARVPTGGPSIISIPACYIETRVEVDDPGTFEPLLLNDTQAFSNRKFEDMANSHDFDDWAEGSVAGGTVVVELLDNYEGTQCCRLETTTNQNSSAYVSQTVTLQRGRRYRVKGWIKRESGNRDLQVRVESSNLFFIGSGLSETTSSQWSASTADNWNEVVNEPIFVDDWEEGEDFATGGGFTKEYWAPFVYYFHTFNGSLSVSPSVAIDIGIPDGESNATVILLDLVECVEVDDVYRQVGEVTNDFEPGRTHYGDSTDSYYCLFPETTSYSNGGLIRYPRGKGEVHVQQPPEGWPQLIPSIGGYFGHLNIVFFITPPTLTEPHQICWAPWGTRRDDVRGWNYATLSENYDDTLECWFFDPVQGYFYSVHRDGSSMEPYIYRLSIDGNTTLTEARFDFNKVLDIAIIDNDEFLEIYVDPEQEIIYLTTQDITTEQRPTYSVHRLKWEDLYFGETNLLQSIEAPAAFQSECYYSMVTDNTLFDSQNNSSYNYDPTDTTLWNDRQCIYFDPDHYDQVFIEVHYSLDTTTTLGQQRSPDLNAELRLYDIDAQLEMVGTEVALSKTGTSPGALDKNQNVVRSTDIKNVFEGRQSQGAYTFDCVVNDGQTSGLFLDFLTVTGVFVVGVFSREEPPTSEFRVTYPMGGGYERTSFSGIASGSPRPLGGAFRYIASDWPDDVTFEFWAVFASDYTGSPGGAPTLVLYEEGDNRTTPVLSATAVTVTGSVGGGDPEDRIPKGGFVRTSKSTFTDGKVYRLYWHDSSGSIDITTCGCGMSVIFNETPTAYPIYFPVGTVGWFSDWLAAGLGAVLFTDEAHRFLEERYVGSTGENDWHVIFSRRSNVSPVTATNRLLSIKNTGFPAHYVILGLTDLNSTSRTFYNDTDDGTSSATPPLERYWYEALFTTSSPSDTDFHALDVVLVKNRRTVSAVFSRKTITGRFFGPPKGLGVSGDIVYVFDEGDRKIYGFSFESEGTFILEDPVSTGDGRVPLVVGAFDNIAYSHLLQRFMIPSSSAGNFISETWTRPNGTDLRPAWNKDFGSTDSTISFVGGWSVTGNVIQMTAAIGTSGRAILYHSKPLKTTTQEATVVINTITGATSEQMGVLLRYNPDTQEGYYAGISSSGNSVGAQRIDGIDSTAYGLGNVSPPSPFVAGDVLKAVIRTFYDADDQEDHAEIDLYKNGVFVMTAVDELSHGRGAIHEGLYTGLIVDGATTSGSGSYQFDTFTAKDLGVPQVDDWVLSTFNPNGGTNWSYVTPTEKLDVRFGEPGSTAGPVWDFISNTRYGMGFPQSFMDLVSFEITAAYCLCLVKTDKTVFEERFQLNVALPEARQALDILSVFTSSFGGTLSWSDGKVRLFAERPFHRVVAAWDESSIQEGSFGFAMSRERDVPNRVRVEFFNSFDDYRRDYVEINDEVDQELTGEIRPVNVLAEALTRASQAARLARQILDSSVINRVIANFRVPLTALGSQPGDVVTLSHTIPGWTNKKFRILEMAEDEDDTFQVTAVSYNPDIFKDVAQDLQLSDLGTGVTRLFGDVEPPARPVLWDQPVIDRFWFLFARDEDSAPVATFAVFQKEPYPDQLTFQNFLDGLDTVTACRLRRNSFLPAGVRLQRSDRAVLEVSNFVGDPIPSGGGRIVVSHLPSVNIAERNWFLARDPNTFGELIPELNWFDDASAGASGGGRTVEAINYATYDDETRTFSNLRRGVDGSVVGETRRGYAGSTLYGGTRDGSAVQARWATIDDDPGNPGSKLMTYQGSYTERTTGIPQPILQTDGDMVIIGGRLLFDGIMIGITDPIDDDQPPLELAFEYCSSEDPTGTTTPGSGPFQGFAISDTIAGGLAGQTDIDSIEWKPLPIFKSTGGKRFYLLDVQTSYNDIRNSTIAGVGTNIPKNQVILEWEIPTDWFKTTIFDSANSFPLVSQMQSRFCIRIRRISGPSDGGYKVRDSFGNESGARTGGLGVYPGEIFDSYNTAVFPDNRTPLHWDYGAEGRGKAFDFKIVTVGVGNQQNDDEFTPVFPQTKIIQ